MKSISVFLLLPLLLLALAACGDAPAEDAVPMPTDGGDEAQISLDPDSPLSNYLDLSQLDPETLAGCTQDLALTDQSGGVTATLRQVVGDAMTAYLTLEVTYPDAAGSTVSGAPAQGDRSQELALAQGTFQTPEEVTGSLTCWSRQDLSTSQNTVTYLYTLSASEPLLAPGEAVTLRFAPPQAPEAVMLFHWTWEIQGPVREARLTDPEGASLGSGIFTPFSACLTLEGPLAAQESIQSGSLTFLDRNGAELQGWQTFPGTAEAGRLQLACLTFLPADPNQVAGIQGAAFQAQVV